MSITLDIRWLLLQIAFLTAILVHQANGQGAQPLRIDPAGAMGGTAGQIAEEVSFIPLESSRQSLFGSIDQLEVTGKYFIILDKQTNAVLIFDKLGKFHAKIAGKNVGYDETKIMYAFFYDKYNDLIRIPYGNESFCYNMKGKLTKKIKVFNYGNVLFNMQNNLTAYYGYRADRRWKDSVAYELVIANEKDIKQKYLPYNQKLANPPAREVLNSQHTINFYPYNDTAVFFVRPYDYTIYDLTPCRFRPAYQFVFPLFNSLPPDFTTDSTRNGKRIQFLRENDNIIYGLSNTYKVGSNLFFKVLGSANQSFIYNLSSAQLICVEKISPDERSFFLPLTDATSGGTEFKNKGFLFADDNYLYTAYSANLLLREKEATAGKLAQYPQQLAEYFRSQHHENDNPVLVQVKFKPAL